MFRCVPPLRLIRFANGDQVCLPCLRKLSRLEARSRQYSSTTFNTAETPVAGRASQSVWTKRYFLANNLWDGDSTTKTAPGSSASTPAASSPPSSPQRDLAAPQVARKPSIKETVLPHRRRRLIESAQAQDSREPQLPLDASSQLSTLSSTLPLNSLRRRAFTYLSLSKPRLTFLIVLTTTASYSLFPVAVSPLDASISLSPLTLLNLTTGTAFSCAAANTLNMLFEPTHDAKMSRTRNRPLVRKLITPRAAYIFAFLTGTAGLALLYVQVNPTVAALSAANIFLYAGVYTPLKRISVVNTWAGAIVGAIPPLMGWAAAAGQQLQQHAADGKLLEPPTWHDILLDPATSPGGYLLALLLYAWQFPHFNALSFPIRHEYAAAGYRMLASVNPAANARVALRYSILLFPICFGLSYVGVTGWGFAATSGLVNAWVLRAAWRFYKLQGHGGSARGLFWASVWHLPLVLVFAMVGKKGLWERVVWGGLDEEEMEEFAANDDIDDRRGEKALLRAK